MTIVTGSDTLLLLAGMWALHAASNRDCEGLVILMLTRLGPVDPQLSSWKQAALAC